MAFAAYVVGAERGFITRAEAARRTLTALEFLAANNESSGFHYHFLNAGTGAREGRSEQSTIDSALLFAGALTAAQYFDRDDSTERSIRRIGTSLYLEANWNWMSPRGPAICHGWTPEKGFLRYDWRGYNEALLVYILALGSPTHPVPPESYDEWLTHYKWKSIYGIEHLYGGPLFLHQMAHTWIDFRGIRDSYMRERNIDYFENSRRATYVQREYAVRNPRKFIGYGENCWGVSASSGPNAGKFHGYKARGVPYGPDDGTVAPWATAASLPFAPEIVLPALEHMGNTAHGFNQTFPSDKSSRGHWVAENSYAIDQGPVLLMLENYQSGLIWNLLRQSPFIRRGLERAGFTGGWLD